MCLVELESGATSVNKGGFTQREGEMDAKGIGAAGGKGPPLQQSAHTCEQFISIPWRRS